MTPSETLPGLILRTRRRDARVIGLIRGTRVRSEWVLAFLSTTWPLLTWSAGRSTSVMSRQSEHLRQNDSTFDDIPQVVLCRAGDTAEAVPRLPQCQGGRPYS